MAFAALALAGEPVYPVKVSENGRAFVDQKGAPVFWMGTTQWQFFREYKLDEARTILAKTREKGFAFVQVMLMGVGDGEKPWIDNNPLRPNESELHTAPPPASPRLQRRADGRGAAGQEEGPKLGTDAFSAGKSVGSRFAREGAELAG